MNKVTEQWLEALGKFELDIDDDNALMKGFVWRVDQNGTRKIDWYMDANDWRELATACEEIAGYLDSIGGNSNG
jgi:hypothetical protein